jgi:hypothetical protein
MSEIKLSESEKKHFELAVEEGAKKVSLIAADKADEVNDLITQMRDEEFSDQQLKIKFTREVLKKAGEMKKKSKDAKEITILEQFEGKVIKGGSVADWEHAGVEKEFKFKVGPWYNKIPFRGEKIDAKTLNTWIGVVDKHSEEIAANKIKLEMYRATRESMGSLRVILSSVRAAVKSGEGAKLKKVVKDYLEARELEQKTEKDLTEMTKKINKIKERVDQALAKLDEKRQKGRELFEKAFKPRLDVLISHKKDMDAADFDAEMLKLREQVREFGDNIGITYMEFFLNESLGIKPVIYVGSPDYKMPETDKEKAREAATTGRWWKKVFGKDLSSRDANLFIEEMRKENPAMLTSIAENSMSDHAERILKFLYNGTLQDGKMVLPTSRRAKLTVPDVVKTLHFAEKYATAGNLENTFTIFAREWKQYTADDFEYAFPLIQNGVAVPLEKAPAATPERKPDEVTQLIKTVFNGNVEKETYEKVFKGHPERDAMLQKWDTAARLQFFVTGKYLPDDTIDFSAKADLLNTDSSHDIILLLKDLELLDRMDEETFKDAVNEYFAKKNSMKGFIKHLEKEFPIT